MKKFTTKFYQVTKKVFCIFEDNPNIQSFIIMVTSQFDDEGGFETIMYPEATSINTNKEDEMKLIEELSKMIYTSKGSAYQFLENVSDKEINAQNIQIYIERALGTDMFSSFMAQYEKEKLEKISNLNIRSPKAIKL